MNDVTKDLLEAQTTVDAETVDRAWARFCGAFGDGPDAPYPGMIAAFEIHYGQSFRDKAWRTEAACWAAAWSKATARAEASLAEPQPDADGWIPWIGDTRSGPKIQVEVQFRNGETDICDPKWLRWEHGSDDSGLLPEDDIIAYRVVEAQP